MNNNDKLLVSVDIDGRGTSLFNYFSDFKGNILGPEDFAVDGDSVYILNSIDNTVLEFKNDKFLYSYSAGLSFGIKIAAESGAIYILRNDFSIMRINGNSIETMPLYNIPTEAIVDFMIMGENIYIVISDGMDGVTYEFGFDIKGLDIGKAKTYHGRIFDENTLYETQLMPYDAGTGGNGKVVVTDIKNGKVQEIPVHTKHFLSGVQYFGSDGKGGTYLKIYESSTNNLYQTIIESRLSLVDAYGQEKYVRDLPEQYKNITNQDKSIDGEIYSLNTFKNGVELVMTAKPNEISTREYSSRLDEVVPPSDTVETMGVDPQKTITREQIMKNAMFYHSFNWSCTEANLLPLPGWTEPRFLNGPGNYTSMPYCWGGNCSAEEYYDGMANGGRVGNINSPGPALLPNTFGHDCSGFVGMCWGETQKYSTNTIREISFPIKDTDLKQGDTLDNPFYHMVLFETRDGWENYLLYESTVFSRFDRVSHTIRPISSLKYYIPLRYKNVEDNETENK